jgi:hypothetical protein
VTSRKPAATLLAAVLLFAGCGAQTQPSPTASAATGATTEPLPTLPTAGPSLTPTATAGPTPVDEGEVRLNESDFVSVELGPLTIGDTVWYLVWPATATEVHPEGTQWYTTPPMEGSPIPAWVAAKVGDAAYMSLERRPELAEIEAYQPVGVTAAGFGDYESAPQPRHDAFLIEWAVAAPTSGTSCSVKISLAPSDADFDAKVAVNTTTTTEKIGPLAGASLVAPWLPAPEGSWETFTVQVTSTCNWAFRLVRLEHD